MSLIPITPQTTTTVTTQFSVPPIPAAQLQAIISGLVAQGIVPDVGLKSGSGSGGFIHFSLDLINQGQVDANGNSLEAYQVTIQPSGQ